MATMISCSSSSKKKRKAKACRLPFWYARGSFMPYVGVRTPWKAVRNALRYRNFFLWKLPHVPSQWPRSLHRRPPSRSLKLLFVCVLRFGRKPPREFSSDKIDRPSTTSRSLARIVEGGGPVDPLSPLPESRPPPFSSVVGALPVWSEVGHSYPRVWNNHVDDLSRFPLIQDRIGLLLPCTLYAIIHH